MCHNILLNTVDTDVNYNQLQKKNHPGKTSSKTDGGWVYIFEFTV